MSRDRPVSLPLPQLFVAMPVTALASILHRASGVALFVGALYLCYLLDLALRDRQGFEQAAALVDTAAGKFGLWLLLAAFGYHLFAGGKHLLLDFHWGDSLAAARVGSYAVFALSAGWAVLAAAWLW